MKLNAKGFSLERWLMILLLAPAPLLLSGCGYVAAGAVGAAVGHEVAEDNEDDD